MRPAAYSLAGGGRRPAQGGCGDRFNGWAVVAAFAAGLMVAVLLLVLSGDRGPAPAPGPFRARASRKGEAARDLTEGLANWSTERVWGLGDTYLPHRLEWDVVMRAMDVPKDAQKFQVLKHPDGKVSLKDSHGMHVVANNNATLVVGAVMADGSLMGLPIDDDGKFALTVDSDSTISLKHVSGRCISANEAGDVYLDDCDGRVGGGARFLPIRMDDGTVALQSKNGLFMTVLIRWVQDYKVSLVMVNQSQADVSQPECTKFYAMEYSNGSVALKTMRSSYITAFGEDSFAADSNDAGAAQLFRTVQNEDDSIFLRTANGSKYATIDFYGKLAATGDSIAPASSFSQNTNPDGTISLANNGKLLCAAERTVKIATCETRRGANESWPMQGVDSAMIVKNLCFNKTWYGFKTKVDVYREYVAGLAQHGSPEDLVILLDNADVAFGGCSYEELISRYAKISLAVGNKPVISGADNAMYPSSDWPYELLDWRRDQVMEAFGMTRDTYCSYTDCPEHMYAYANSGFLMGPPKELEAVLLCMLQKGWGDFGKFGFDDQEGLHACIFDHPELITLDYTGLLALQLIFMEEESSVLYDSDGRVHNKAAGGAVQCFVHGNGDTMKSWFPSLFPGIQETERWISAAVSGTV